MFTLRTAGNEYLIDGETLTQIAVLIFIFGMMLVLMIPLF